LDVCGDLALPRHCRVTARLRGVALRCAVQQRQRHDAGDEDRGGAAGEAATDPAAAASVADAPVGECLIELGQGAGPARAPARVVMEWFIAPEQAARAAAFAPLPRGCPELVA